MSVLVLKSGLLTTLQDAGRPGHAALGVGRAGAMDQPAWQLANALVGNTHSEAALEFTLVGPTLRFERAVDIALTGAVPRAEVDGHALPGWTRCHLPAGSVLKLGGMAHGCRGYLAVGGGFDAAYVLGSRSADLHAKLGPLDGRALREGDRLELGERVPPSLWPSDDAVQVAPWSLDPQPWFDLAPLQPERFELPPMSLALLPGSHTAQLDASSLERLHTQPFTISKDANRTASRLDGQMLSLRAPLELISEAVLPGTLQLPPSGQPIVLLAEAPVTGGYPRIGQLAAADLPRLAQRRPGDAVCFHACTLEQASARLAAKRQRLDGLLAAIARRMQDGY
jgi:biotin-dependent carboxylase-like uncharacterized protein